MTRPLLSDRPHRLVCSLAGLLLMGSLGCLPVEENNASNNTTQTNNTTATNNTTGGTNNTTGGTNNTTGGTNNTTGGTNNNPGDARVRLTTTGAREVAAGESVTPTTLNGIPTQSYGRESFTFGNVGDAPITIDRITLTPKAPEAVEQWFIMDYNDPNIGKYIYESKDYAGEVLQPGEALEMEAVFNCLQYGVSEAELRIEYDGGKLYTITITARGRQNTVLTGAFETLGEWAFGHALKFSETNTMVLDAQKNAILSVNAREWVDRFASDYAISSISPTGEVRWAKVFDGGFEDGVDSAVERYPGGMNRSVAVDKDGFIYAVGKTSVGAQNNTFKALILKIDPSDGAIVWARTWQAQQDLGQVRASARATAVDVTLDGRLIVTGMAGSPAALMVLAVDKATGELIYERAITPPGTNVSGLVTRVQADGSAYMSALANGSAYLLRVTGLSGAGPEVDWARAMNLGSQSHNIHDIDVDAEGNAYLAIDIRGAQTYGLMARVNSSGSLAWAKQFNTRNVSQNDKIYAVTVSGDKVYFGGSVGISPYGSVGGDALLMRLNRADGSYDWGAFYYNGVGIELRSNWAVRALIVDGDELRVGLSTDTASSNYVHYEGYWYGLPDEVNAADPPGTGSERVEDALSLAPTAATSSFSVGDWPNGPVYLTPDTTDAWMDAPLAVKNTPLRDMTGNGGHKLAAMMTLKVK